MLPKPPLAPFQGACRQIKPDQPRYLRVKKNEIVPGTATGIEENISCVRRNKVDDLLRRHFFDVRRTRTRTAIEYRVGYITARLVFPELVPWRGINHPQFTPVALAIITRPVNKLPARTFDRIVATSPCDRVESVKNECMRDARPLPKTTRTVHARS